MYTMAKASQSQCLNLNDLITIAAYFVRGIGVDGFGR